MLKRICALLLLVALVFAFTGCEIHFADGTRYDVPWQFGVLDFGIRSV